MKLTLKQANELLKESLTAIVKGQSYSEENQVLINKLKAVLGIKPTNSRPLIIKAMIDEGRLGCFETIDQLYDPKNYLVTVTDKKGNLILDEVEGYDIEDE